MDVMTVPERKPEPLTAIPGTSPAVLATVIAFAPTMIGTVAPAVAADEMLKVVPLGIEEIVAPAGMPAPVTSMPTANVVVAGPLIRVLPLVVTAPVKACPA